MISLQVAVLVVAVPSSRRQTGPPLSFNLQISLGLQKQPSQGSERRIQFFPVIGYAMILSLKKTHEYRENLLQQRRESATI